MATAFHFRAVASDGKLRTGTLTAETDKLAARELRRQGLIPVFVGAEPKRGLDIYFIDTEGGAATFFSSPRNSRRCSTPGSRWIARFRSPRS